MDRSLPVWILTALALAALIVLPLGWLGWMSVSEPTGLTVGHYTSAFTHDQAEAMAISDRIAVLDRGRVAQVGTPTDLFEQPRTRFVAEFIGKTNVLEATAVSLDTVEREGIRLRVRDGGLTPGAPIVISIRPHLIALVDPPVAGVASDPLLNVLRGTVTRQAYLGDSVQGEVKLDGVNVTLRVATRAPAKLATHDLVTLCIPATPAFPFPGPTHDRSRHRCRRFDRDAATLP